MKLNRVLLALALVAGVLALVLQFSNRYSIKRAQKSLDELEESRSRLLIRRSQIVGDRSLVVVDGAGVVWSDGGRLCMAALDDFTARCISADGGVEIVPIEP